MIRSRSLPLSPRMLPIFEGDERKYQIWTIGTASEICPIRSRRTLFWVTSTPQRSQMIPLYRMRLYLPQWHSQSRTGPKIFSQNNPSFSGRNDRQLIVSGFGTSPWDRERIRSDDASVIVIFEKFFLMIFSCVNAIVR